MLSRFTEDSTELTTGDDDLHWKIIFTFFYLINNIEIIAKRFLENRVMMSHYLEKKYLLNLLQHVFVQIKIREKKPIKF